jgi:hypothetical protein
MRLDRSCGRVKEGKELGKRTKDKETDARRAGSKIFQIMGNNLQGNLVSSIAFP